MVLSCFKSRGRFQVLTKIPPGTTDVRTKFASPPSNIYQEISALSKQSGGLITKVLHFGKYLNLIFHQKWDENIKSSTYRDEAWSPLA